MTKIVRYIFFSIKKDQMTTWHAVKLVKVPIHEKNTNVWNRLPVDFDCVAYSVYMLKNNIDKYLRREGYT